MSMRIIIAFVIIFNIKVVFSSSYPKMSVKRENCSTCFIDISMNIIQQCFNDKKGPIILTGNSSEIHIKYNGDAFSTVALVGISDLRKANYYMRNRGVFKLELIEVLSKPYPANLFLLYDIHPSSLSLLLEELRKSTWWNGMGIFFLTSANGTCDGARYILEVAFDFNVINAVFFCNITDNGTEFYTINPYSQNAPDEWEFVDIREQRKGFMSTLFKRLYFQEKSNKLPVCENLIFDKTKKLETYPLTLCATPIPILMPVDLASPFKISGMSVQILHIILEKLEAPYRVKLNESRGIIDHNGTPSDLIADILYGRCDMGINIEYRRNLWRNEINIFESSGLCIVTLKDEISIVEQVGRILTPEFFQLLGLILASSTISLRLFFGRSVVLDVLRMMTSVSAMYRPRRRSERLLFAWYVVLFMGFSSYVQSQLNALLAVPSYRPTVDTKEDLANSKHEIHSDRYFNQFLDDSRMVPRLRDRGSFVKCIGRLSKGENVACLEDCTVIKFGINRSDVMHVSRSSMFDNYLTFLTHEDWPLFYRMDLMYKRLLEAGAFQYIHQQIEAINSRRNEGVDRQSTRIFTLEELTYSFCLLAVSYAIAILVFLGELVVSYFRTAYRLK